MGRFRYHHLRHAHRQPIHGAVTEAPTLKAGAVTPVVTAIGVFGVIYGAAASEIMGPTAAIASSMLVFSGVAQFSMVGLLATGATSGTVLAVVAILGLRHLPLGAILTHG